MARLRTSVNRLIWAVTPVLLLVIQADALGRRWL